MVHQALNFGMPGIFREGDAAKNLSTHQTVKFDAQKFLAPFPSAESSFEANFCADFPPFCCVTHAVFQKEAWEFCFCSEQGFNTILVALLFVWTALCTRL